MKILAIDTATDETSAAVTQNTKVFSNVVWSQSSLHAKFGGVYPTLAQREHRARIDFVINKALKRSGTKITDIDAVAVTLGPGLAIALEVGIAKAKEIAALNKKPLIPVNHVEGHILSPLAQPKTQKEETKLKLPAVGIVLSGGTTQIILVKKIGEYEILAQTVDDSLGEALDKGARLLGFGYPGGAVLEKIAREGKLIYPLPIPMIGREDRHQFSYSGLKTALVRIFRDLEKNKKINKKVISDLSASYQNVAFNHVENMLKFLLSEQKSVKTILLGGGVGANVELRKRIRTVMKENSLSLLIPYSKRLFTDNAAMIGVAGYYSYKRGVQIDPSSDTIDRTPRLKITDKII